MHPKSGNLKPDSRWRAEILPAVGSRLGRVLSLAVLMVAVALPTCCRGVQIPPWQFSATNQVITFETGLTVVPEFPGLQFAGGVTSFSGWGFGSQVFGNLNSATYLDVYFDSPQQAVGAYIAYGGTITETVYDQSNNVIEFASASSGASLVFLGIGQPTAQIYRAEWRYATPTYFGIDNVIFGTASGLSQLPHIPTGLTGAVQGVSVNLNWLASTNSTGYVVKRATQSNGPYTVIANNVPGSNFTDTAVTNGAIYYYVVVGLNAYGQSGNSHELEIYMLNHFAFDAIGGLQTSSVPFAVSLSARDGQGNLLTNFNGATSLTATGNRGPVLLSSSPVVFFTNGQWTGAVTIAPPYPDSNVRLTCRSNAVVGVSNPFEVRPPAVQLFDFTAASMAYSPVRERLYATVPASAATFSNCLVVIDPALGRIETSFYLGDDPSRLSVSDDGRYIYLGFNNANVFRRFDLQSGVTDLEVSLGNHPYYTWNQYKVADLVALPGNPRSVAVEDNAYGIDPRVAIYDDGVGRSNVLISIASGSLQAASSNRLYASLPFTAFSVDAAGVSSYTPGSWIVGYYEAIKFQSGLMFTSGGRVFDPETFEVFGYLPPCSVVEPDVARGRIFSLVSTPVWAQPPAWTILACDLVALETVASQPVPGVYGDPVNLLRWGTNGLAFCTSQNQLWLVRTALIPAGTSADLALSANASPQPATLNSPLTYTIQVTKQGPGDALEVQFQDFLPLGASFVSASSTVGSCLWSNGMVRAALGTLVSTGSVSISITVIPTIIGVLTNKAVISASNLDPSVANNSQLTITPTQYAPFVNTQDPWILRNTNATLNGMAVPNGLPTTAWFEVGKRDEPMQVVGTTNVSPGGAVVPVQAAFDGLIAGAVYRCRLVASNAAGMASGAFAYFTTGHKVVGWDRAGNPQKGVATGLSNAVALAAGGFHSLALRSDGSLSAWGDNAFGQTNIPSSLSNVVAIGAGEYHSLALRVNGEVVGWGKNNLRQTNVPPGLGGVWRIAAGDYHNFALTPDGRLVGWGYNDQGQANVPAGLSNVVGVGAGLYHSTALKADGTVVAWGDNSYAGQTNVPTNLNSVVAISAGGFHNLALRQDGTVIAWGENSYGQATIPAGLSNVVAIAAGFRHSLALKDDGTTMGWGLIGASPTGLVQVTRIASGEFFSLATGANLIPLTDSQVVVSPANQDVAVTLGAFDLNGDVLTYRITALPAAGTLYQFTNGTRGDQIVNAQTVVADSAHRVIFAPAPDGAGNPYASFAFAVNDGEADSSPATVTLSIGNTAAHTQAALNITSNSAVLGGMVLPNGLATAAWFEWGERGGFGNVTSAQPVGSGSAVVRVSQPISGLTPGGVYQCRLVASNASGVLPGAPVVFSTGRKVAVWGGTTFGLNVAPVGLSNVVAVAAGIYHLLALKADGKVVAWGQNTYGQTSVPASLSNVVAIGAGSGHSLALKADGTLVAWGLNDYGQRNIPAGLSNVVAVAVGERHNLALKSDGTIVGWGWNYYSQATVPPGTSNVVALAAGQAHSSVVKADGSLLTWGTSAYELTKSPAGSNFFVATAAGSYHGLALTREGKVLGWGQNTEVPPNLDNVVAIAKGVSHSLAMKLDGQLVIWGYNSVGQGAVPPGLSNVVAASGGVWNTLAIGDNVPPTATTQVTNGPANRDLVVTLKASDLNNDPLTFRISALPTAGRLFQFAGSTRGTAITNVGAVVSDPNKRVIFAPQLNSFGSPCSYFEFTVSDGEADSAPAAVTINIASPILGQVKSGVWLSGESFRLDLLGDSNTAYTIWASTNLLDWHLLGPATPLSNGWFQYLDADATNWPARFYRSGLQ